MFNAILDDNYINACRRFERAFRRHILDKLEAALIDNEDISFYELDGTLDSLRKDVS